MYAKDEVDKKIKEAKVAFLEAVEAQIEYDEIYGENEDEK